MYNWAINKLKLERAANWVRSQGELTEEKVRERYILLGGKVVGYEPEPVKVAEPKEELPPEVTFEVEAKPKKVKKTDE